MLGGEACMPRSRAQGPPHPESAPLLLVELPLRQGQGAVLLVPEDGAALPEVGAVVCGSLGSASTPRHPPTLAGTSFPNPSPVFPPASEGHPTTSSQSRADARTPQLLSPPALPGTQ